VKGWYILTENGPVLASTNEWSRWRETKPEESRIDRTEVGDVEVSTVFLGLDHGWGEGPPVLFETMTFGGDEDTNECQWRYTTRAAAQAGHDAIVAALQAGTPLGDLDLR
jgi:hypothetical protein